MKTLLILLLPLALFARSQNLEVQHGSASIHENGKHVRIENSPNAILQWQDFSIAQGESVHFAQEHAKSTVLNRVTSGQASNLLGQLTSNGAVFLINPSGVLIGADAHIQTAGFLASTADISNENFLKGDYLFSHPGDGHITNHGVIECPQGDIYLIAKTIKNTGTLQAENVSQISAYEVLITPHANEKVTIRTELDESEITSLIQDLVSNPYERAIHHTGKIEAYGSNEESGKVYLIAHKRDIRIEGSIKAPGGDVQIVGEEVYVTKSAILDASGPQGGTLSIGRGLEELNAQKTTLEKGATLATSGTEESAGDILIWSETDTYCAATIEAAALGTKGDGGFLEISGKNTAEAPLIPNLSSAYGKTGTILFDPGSITITNGASPGTGGVYGVTYLQGLLASSNVSLDTFTDSGNGNPQTLTVTSAVTGANALTWSSNSDLSITARRNIEVQSGAQISFSGSGTLTATALGSIVGQTHPGISLSGLSLSATGSGNITLTGTGGDTGTGNEGIRIQGATNLSTATGTLTMTGTGGNASHGISITSGTVTTSGTGAMNLTGNGGTGTASTGIFLSGGASQITTTGSGPVTLIGTGGGAGTGANRISVFSGADVAPTGTSTLTMNGTASPLASGSVGINVSSVVVTTSAGTMGLTCEGGGVGNSNRGLQTNQSITSTGGGDITINAVGTPSGASSNIGVNIIANSGGIACSLGNGGNIMIDATGSATIAGGNSNIGILLPAGGNGVNRFIRTPDAIDITARGTGIGLGSGSGNIGLSVGLRSRIESTSGPITVVAEGGGIGGSCRGLEIIQSSGLTASGAMNVTATGSSDTGATGGGNIGIRLSRVANSISTNTGNIDVTAVGATDSTGDGNIGIRVDDTGGGAIVSNTTNGGDITIVATGSEKLGGGSNNYGVRLEPAGNGAANNIQTSGAIDITARGAGVGSGSGNIGLSTNLRSLIRSTGTGAGSSVNVLGVSGGTVGSVNRGIELLSIGAIQSVGGNLTLQGIGGGASPGTNNQGVFISGATGLVRSQDGAISVTGNGGFASPGIQVSAGTIDTTGIGSINCVGTTVGSQGILLMGSSSRVNTAVQGAISLTGTGGGTAPGGDGIRVISGADVLAGGSGQITLTGTGSATGGGSSRGILVSGSGSLVRSISGDIILNGTGGNGGDGNNGVEVSGGGDITSTNGTIRSTITSLGGNGNANCHGILVNGAGSTITTTNGEVDLIGMGGGSTSPNHGIFVLGGGQISSTGPLFQLNGTGNGTGSGNSGINLNNATISQVATDVTLTGTGSPTGLNNNYGIELSNGTGITTDSGGINLTANGRGTGQNNHGIFFTSAGNITTTSGAIVINATGSSTGTNQCMGLLVDGAGTEITAANNGSINITATGQGNAVTNPGLLIQNGGSINTTGNAPITVLATGSTAGSSGCAGITLTGASSEITTDTGAMNLTGNAGGSTSDNSGIEVLGGALITSTGGGNLTLTGQGAGASQDNRGIYVTTPSQINTTSGTITATGTGGTGTTGCFGILVDGASAQILSSTGTVDLTGTGTGTLASNAGIRISNGATVAFTDTNVTLIGNGSTAGTDANYGIELLGSGITTGSGNISLTGNGGGTGQDNHGISFTSPGNITSTSGGIVIDATGSSTGTTQCMGLLVDGVGTEITSTTGDISVAGTGGGSGTSNPGIFVRNQGSIHSTSGAISLTGTAASGTLEGITLENQAHVFTSGEVNVVTFSDLLITDNSSIDAQGNNPATFDITTDVRILGGSGATTPAYINLTDGTATFTIGRDLVLQGGTGTDSQAQIGNIGLSLNASSPMTFQVGRDVILTGGLADDSFAQIGHLDMIGSTLGGNITLTCENDLNILGGTDPSGYARIGHGGQMSGTISPSIMVLIAGRDTNITSAVGDAQIVNENGPLTLVVDNLSPTFPGIGLGAFNLNSTLTATGELRIYTARQSQNTINDLINGAVFTPGAFDVNTDTEQWRTYFAGGTYEGAAFKFYYKDPIVFPSQVNVTPQVARTFFGDVAANLVELAEILPTFQSLRAPRHFPNYHFKVCLEEQQDRKCSPNFSPYGSFIFEDSVWWIGESF